MNSGSYSWQYDKMNENSGSKKMKILFIGDVVGSMGREMIHDYLPRLKKKFKPQLSIVNGENAAGGRGITEKIYKELLKDGADVVTMGNHTWDNHDIEEFIGSATKLVRPANYPTGTPGVGYRTINVNGTKVVVVNMMGTVFMAQLDNPFNKMDEILAEIDDDNAIIFVDLHAEVTSEKQAFGWDFDGKVSAVVGTHTHVQTNDARILPQGTAYQTDVGMTGPYDGILGMGMESIIWKFRNQRPARFEVVQEGRGLLSGCLIEFNDKGRAISIKPILINEDHPYRDD